MPHIKCTHGTHHMTGHERRQPSTESCARRFVWGNKDHAKMTHAKTAPVKRDLGAPSKHTQNHSQRCSHGYGARDAGEGVRVEGSKRQPYPLIDSVTELIAGLCKRESNQPRPGVAPGCPQHEAEGST